MNDATKALLEEYELNAFADQIDELFRPTIRLIATKSDSVPAGASRFGGHPDLPPGAEWPERDGVPMEFVGQLRLEEVKPYDVSGLLPPTGSLLFFHNTQWETSDNVAEEDAYDVCRVLYHPGPATELVSTAPSVVEFERFGEVEPAPAVFSSSRLSFDKMVTLPPGESAFLRDDKYQELVKVYYDFRIDFDEKVLELRPDNKDHRMLGYLNLDDYVEAMEVDDVVLLQVDSDWDAAGFQWGDEEQIYFILKAEDLAAGRFDRVRLYSMLG